MTIGPVDTRVQSWIYEMEHGRGLRWIRALLVALLIAGVTSVYVLREFKGLRNAEAMDHAQVARTLSEGNGFRTRVIRPLGLWQIQQHEIRKTGQKVLPRQFLFENAYYQRETLVPPVYPVLLAVPFRILRAVKPDAFLVSQNYRMGMFPPELLVMIPGGLFSMLLSGFLVFRIALRLLDRRAAWLTFFVYLFSNAVWATAVSGRNLAFLGLVFTLTVYLMVVAESWHERRVHGFWKWIFLGAAGGLTAIGFLTRYSYGLVIIGLLIWALAGFRGRRLPAALWMLFVFLLTVSPWCVWMYRASGSPLGIAPYQVFQGTDAYPDDLVMKTLAFDSEKASFFEVFRKFLGNVRDFFTQRLLLIGGNLVAAFFVVALMHRFRRRSVRRVYGFVWTCLLLFAFAEAAVVPDPNGMTMILLPLMTLFAVVVFLVLLDRMRIPFQIVRIVVIVAFVLANSIGMAMALALPGDTLPYPPYWPPMIRFLSSTIQPNEVMMADIPEGVAWYGHRRSLPLTPDIEREFYAWHDYILAGRLKALYLTTVTRNLPFLDGLLKGPMRTWGQIIALGAVPPEFPFFKTIRPMNNDDQLFLSDTERWRIVAEASASQ